MAIRNTENLTNLLTDLADYRMQSLSQIAHLHFSGKRAARRRMQQLLEDAFVELLPGAPAQGGGRPENVYGLSKAGLQLLKGQGIFEEKISFEQVGGGNLSYQAGHQSLLGWFRVHLVHLCRAIPQLECRLLSCNSPLALDPETGVPTIRDEVLIGNDTPPQCFTPDAAFIVADTHRQKSVLFFLEVDMGTEPLSSEGGGDIREKVQRYKKYFRSRGYKRYEVLWGVPLNGFRLLFLAHSDSRLGPLSSSIRSMGSTEFVWTTSADSMFREGASGRIWVPGGRSDCPAESILGSLAQPGALPKLSE